MADISKITLPSGTSYNIKDATARSDLAGKISAPSSPTSGDILTFNGTTWVADDPPPGAFIATYGTTTAADIYAAHQAGYVCVCTYLGITMYLIEVSSTFAHFLGLWGGTAYWVSVSSILGWENGQTAMASLNSPTFAGTPKAPTAAVGTNSTQIATTAFVANAIASVLSGGVIFRGQTTTALTDGSTTNPITINGNSYTAVQGDLVVSGNKEFIFDGTHWIELGDLDALGDLAWKDSASGSYTPTGSVSVSTNSTTNKTATVSKASSGAATYTPEGSVSAPTISVATAGATTTVNSITDVGTLPSFSATVSNENLTLGFSQGTLPTKGSNTTVKTGDASYTASAPTFTGTGARLVTGNIAVPSSYTATFTGTAATISVS